MTCRVYFHSFLSKKTQQQEIINEFLPIDGVWTPWSAYNVTLGPCLGGGPAEEYIVRKRRECLPVLGGVAKCLPEGEIQDRIDSVENCPGINCY